MGIFMFGRGSQHAMYQALEVRLSKLETSHSDLRTRCAQIYAQVDRTHSAKLAAQITDLQQALEVHQHSVRQQLGKLYGRQRSEPAEPQPVSRDTLRAQLLGGKR
jgi:hypothetical protein